MSVTSTTLFCLNEFLKCELNIYGIGGKSLQYRMFVWVTDNLFSNFYTRCPQKHTNKKTWPKTISRILSECERQNGLNHQYFFKTSLHMIDMFKFEQKMNWSAVYLSDVSNANRQNTLNSIVFWSSKGSNSCIPKTVILNTKRFVRYRKVRYTYFAWPNTKDHSERKSDVVQGIKKKG